MRKDRWELEIELDLVNQKNTLLENEFDTTHASYLEQKEREPHDVEELLRLEKKIIRIRELTQKNDSQREYLMVRLGLVDPDNQ